MLSKEIISKRFSEIIPCENSDLKSEVVGLYFEALSMTHLIEIHGYSQDHRFYEFLEYEVFDAISKTEAYIKKLLLRMEGIDGEKNAKYWVVRRKSDNKLIGTAALVNLNLDRRSIEWGYGVDPNLWGGGYILEIQQILKRYVFEVLGLNRLCGITMTNNNRTISSLLATGMKNEGVLRQYFCKDDVFVDGWQYSMISKDYFEVVEACESLNCSPILIDEILDLVRAALEDDLIDESSTMQNTASWDSFSHMGLMVMISESLKISLTPSEMMQATSVSALEKILKKRYSK